MVTTHKEPNNFRSHLVYKKAQEMADSLIWDLTEGNLVQCQTDNQKKAWSFPEHNNIEQSEGIKFLQGRCKFVRVSYDAYSRSCISVSINLLDRIRVAHFCLGFYCTERSSRPVNASLGSYR